MALSLKRIELEHTSSPESRITQVIVPDPMQGHTTKVILGPSLGIACEASAAS